jgi:hypothetical protein
MMVVMMMIMMMVMVMMMMIPIEVTDDGIVNDVIGQE